MKLLTKILNAFKPKYQLVYRTAQGATAMYTITKPKHSDEFGNITEGKDVVGKVPSRRPFAMLFQDHNLYDTLSYHNQLMDKYLQSQVFSTSQRPIT